MMRLFRTVMLLVVSAIMGALATVRMLAPPRKALTVEIPGTPHEAGWKQRLPVLARHFALFLALIAVGGFLVAASGIVSIKASTGHWDITEWFLNFSSKRSVATHTIGGTAPDLNKPWLVMKGAGHYDTGCRPCHGSPDRPRSRIALEMTPTPPYLPSEVSEWKPDDLFYIVKHGIKLTGMPAWPAQERDDEVWAMTAFLLALPDMDAEEYARLVDEAISPAGINTSLLDTREDVPRVVEENCARCHGIRGFGRGTGAFPVLAGQSPTYLYAALRAYAEGDRHSGFMEPVAADLSIEEMRELALYYGGQNHPALLPAHVSQVPDTMEIELGRIIAHEGIPSEGVPSCADCHGPGVGPRNPFYPTLAGQYADYIELQLDLFKQRQRGGSVYAHLMYPVADRLTPEQMRAVSLYYASLADIRDSPTP